jgi:phospholipid-binding lipoprotein MlaA
MLRLNSLPARLAVLLLTLTLAAGCTAVPAERLGSVPPRSPVTAQEQQEVYPIDVYDPLEGFNRHVYNFNARFDRYVFLPVVNGYTRVTPDFLEDRVSSFFNNLSEFRNGVNGTLQGRPQVAGTALARLFINSTVGVLGLFDLATEFGIPEHEEDFGQTLGRWGMRSGPYLVLPILGPSNLRDAGGVAADTAATNLLPVVQDVNDSVYFNPAVYTLYFIDARRRVGFRYYRSGSPFEYDLIRFLYTKKRELDILK